jgi:uncharacterized protein (DUF1330 family)
MLNLLRFKDRADGVAAGMSGAEAYAHYAAAAEPFVEAVGGSMVLAMEARESVIGPPEGEWNYVMIVRYPSRAKFLEFATGSEYLEVHAYREAALADSRLIACAIPVAEPSS